MFPFADLQRVLGLQLCQAQALQARCRAGVLGRHAAGSPRPVLHRRSRHALCGQGGRQAIKRAIGACIGRLPRRAQQRSNRGEEHLHV